MEEYSTLIRSVNAARNLVDPDNYERSVENMLTFINQRMEYLQSTDLLGK